MVINKIAISGKAGSGKDTFAKILCTKLRTLVLTSSNGDKYRAATHTRTFAFADPMKEIAKIMFPDRIGEDCLWGDSSKRQTNIADALDAEGLPLTIRKLLTDLGKFGRRLDANIWIRATTAPVDEFLKKNQYRVAVITDVRFKNEFQTLKEQGYYMFRIKRPSQLIIDDISEKDLDSVEDSEFDLVIENDKSLEDLSKTIRSWVRENYSH